MTVFPFTCHSPPGVDCLPPRLGDLHANDLDGSSAGDDPPTGALESRARASAPPCSRHATRRAVRGRDGGRAWARGASRGEFYSFGRIPRELWRRRQAPSTAVVGSKYLVIAYGSSDLLP